ncbi:MAG: gliding motility-associated ABC transporter permease subunit GldF [Saprospiraceae bacterium]
MWAICVKEIRSFFSSLMGYIVIAVILVTMGLMMWVFPDYSVLDNVYASLDQLFVLAPMLFVFLIPAITMRSFADENQNGTIELLATRPLRDREIIIGKFLACLILVVIALIPTALYYYTVYQLGSPPGNLDSGGIFGAYIGLFFLAASFVSIGVFASALSNNQVVSFILATFLCFFFYWGFQFISRLPVFVGKWDDFVQHFGIDLHYFSMSRGLVDSRDLIYFLSVIFLFLFFTFMSLDSRKWEKSA